MEKQGYYQDPNVLSPLPPKERPPLTARHRWLLLGAFCIGLAIQFFLWDMPDSLDWRFGLGYAAIWIVCLVVFHIFCYKQALRRPIALPFGVTALFLCVLCVPQANGYSDPQLLVSNMLIIPCLLMFYTVIVASPKPPQQQESAYIPLFFYGFFALPFISIGEFFRSIGSLFQKKGQNRVVWIGLLAAIPVAGVVLALLLSADAVMKSYAEIWLKDVHLGEYCMRAVITSVAAALFYSFLYQNIWGTPLEIKQRESKGWPPVAARIVVAALLAIYLVFTCVQFLYLFGGYGLPAELTYSEYARQGFSQLIWVAAINLAVYGACLCRVKQDAVLKGMLLGLLAATAVILASAFTRLGLYIQAYDLTFRRIQAFWLLAYISAVIVLCGVRLYREKLPLLRISALLLLLWYAALNIPDLNLLYALRF